MTKQMLKAKALDIEEMGRAELSDFSVVVSTSMIDNKSKYFLYEAIEKREEELDLKVSPMAESSEIDYDE